jgi:hypothetical protein
MVLIRAHQSSLWMVDTEGNVTTIVIPAFKLWTKKDWFVLSQITATLFDKDFPTIFKNG